MRSYKNIVCRKEYLHLQQKNQKVNMFFKRFIRQQTPSLHRIQPQQNNLALFMGLGFVVGAVYYFYARGDRVLKMQAEGRDKNLASKGEANRPRTFSSATSASGSPAMFDATKNGHKDENKY